MDDETELKESLIAALDASIRKGIETLPTLGIDTLEYTNALTNIIRSMGALSGLKNGNLTNKNQN